MRAALPCLLIAALVSIGCAGHPAAPDYQPATDQAINPVSSNAGTHQCLGYYALKVDTGTLDVEMIPLRSAEWHFNLTGILNGTMGVSAAVVPGESDPMNGLFVLDITLTHPFLDHTQFSGFDVKGILMTPGTLEVGPLIFADADETELENADGYTRWWNPSEFPHPGVFGYTNGNLASAAPGALTATVNPYKYFADVFGPVAGMEMVTDEPLDSDMGRGVFTAGSANARRYEIRFPVDTAPQIVYGYAIDCSWGPPSPNPPEQVPDDFPIEANQPESYRIAIGQIQNNLYYDSESGIGGGVLRLQINVHDWQGQMAGDITSEINAVRIFAPGLMSGGVDGVYLNETPVKTRYTVDLTGVAVPSQSGETKIICRVGSADGSTYRQAVPPAPDETLSAFHAITIDIPDPECRGDANNSFEEAEAVDIGDWVSGQICLPDDYRDFYSFEIPSGNTLSGGINLYCDAEPTTLGIYNSDEELIREVSVSGGMASIPVNGAPFWPGQYYLRVYTSNDIQVAPYYLQLGIELTDVTPTNPVEVTPDWLYCEPDYTWLQDNYLIMYGHLDGLWVYDITDPSNPVQVTAIHMEMNHEGVLQYPYLYYIKSQGGGIQHVDLIDLTDVTSPVFHPSVIEFDVGLKNLLINSEYLFVLTDEETDSRCFVYDYTSVPTSPEEIYSTLMPASDFWLYRPEGSNTHMLFQDASVDDELWSYDIENITSWECDDSILLDKKIRDITGDGYYFYIANWNSADVNSTLTVYHHNDLGTMIFDGSTTCASLFYSITEDGDYVYGSGYGGLGVVDVSDKAHPDELSTTPLNGTPMHTAIDGDDMYVTIIEAGEMVFNISVPSVPTKILEFPVADNIRAMQAFGDYLVIADDNYQAYHTIKVVDISDPADAEIVLRMPVTSSCMLMASDDDVLAARIGGYETWLIDVTDPMYLSHEGTITSGEVIYGLAIKDDAIYISEEDNDLLVYDISDLSAPSYIRTVDLTYNLTFLTCTDNYLLGKSDLNDIRIFSLSNPWNPAYLGTYVPSDAPGEIRAIDDYAYIVCDRVFEIADISNPSSPVYAGSVSLPGTLDYNYMDTDGLFAYLTGWAYSFPNPVICSLWPPNDPAIVYTFDPWEHGTTEDVLEQEGYLYVSSTTHGLRIYDLY
jgi:hypothetical protein